MRTNALQSPVATHWQSRAKMKDRLYWQPSWLHQRYWEEKLSARKIAALCGVKACTIHKHMKRLDIPSRSFSEARLINYPVSPYRDKKWLSKAYCKENNSLYDISAVCGRDRTTVRDWFREFGIPVRGRVEAQRIQRRKYYRSKFSRLTTWLWNIAKKFDAYMREQDRQDN